MDEFERLKDEQSKETAEPFWNLNGQRDEMATKSLFPSLSTPNSSFTLRIPLDLQMSNRYLQLTDQAISDSSISIPSVLVAPALVDLALYEEGQARDDALKVMLETFSRGTVVAEEGSLLAEVLGKEDGRFPCVFDGTMDGGRTKKWRIDHK